ncbi:MAG TPA: HdeD family acid-resistance protein [Candidatus Pacearchaeota archaeon]|nr:HdeD family acid-resistance protein [Candidatus Pacearchaeota archaeon]HPZ74957.1 HdeD family acid-resistance protein [Candidatus Pacearchaeota archaeon]
MNNIVMIKNSVKYWYLVLVVGIISIGVGLWVMIFPRESITVTALVFVLTFLITGLFETIFAIANRNAMTNWGWGLALGILNLIIGVLLLLNPAISVLTLAFYVGFVILFHSLAAIIIAFDLKRYLILQWGNLLAMGIIGFILAVLLLVNPSLTTMVVVIFLGLALIIGGTMSIYFSLKLKKIKERAQKISSDLMSRYEAIRKEIEDIFRG